ncbi:MAG: hypothetical protein OSA48_10500, partial [Akkermansiaceae bacterium]|nr:hypothetical protein [Akkermansiaceae bacterium]
HAEDHAEDHTEDHANEHQQRIQDDGPVAPEFDFHEESDPAATEEGESEDISDPWPEETDDDEDDDGPPEDIPEEEKNR